jgi:hypothetical protein
MVSTLLEILVGGVWRDVAATAPEPVSTLLEILDGGADSRDTRRPRRVFSTLLEILACIVERSSGVYWT